MFWTLKECETWTCNQSRQSSSQSRNSQIGISEKLCRKHTQKNITHGSQMISNRQGLGKKKFNFKKTRQLQTRLERISREVPLSSMEFPWSSRGFQGVQEDSKIFQKSQYMLQSNFSFSFTTQQSSGRNKYRQMTGDSKITFV